MASMSSTRDKIVDVRGDVIVTVRVLRAERARPRPVVHFVLILRGCVSCCEQHVGAVLDPPRGAGVGRTAIRPVVLEAAILRRIVRRRDHDAVGQFVRQAAVVRQNGVGERRRGRVAHVVIDHHLHAVRRQHFQRGDEGRLGQRVGVLGQEQRTVVPPLIFAVIADRLRDRQDVALIERAVAAKSRGARRCRRPPAATPRRDPDGRCSRR